MTGPEHYAEAERLITAIPDGLPHEDIAMIQRAAQVHATLAAAAATADPFSSETAWQQVTR